MTGRTRLQLEDWNHRQVRKIVEEFPWLSALDRKINTVLCVMRNGLRVRHKIPFQQPCLAPCPTHRFSLLSGSFSDMGGNGGKNILFPRKKVLFNYHQLLNYVQLGLHIFSSIYYYTA